MLTVDPPKPYILGVFYKDDFLISLINESSYLRNDRISYSVYFRSINSRVPVENEGFSENCYL